MPDTSNQLADQVFQWCVQFLVWLASVTGATYKEINVILFCVIWPLLTVGLIGLCVFQRFDAYPWFTTNKISPHYILLAAV